MMEDSLRKGPLAVKAVHDVIQPESDEEIFAEGIYKSCGMYVAIEVGQGTQLSADPRNFSRT